MGSGLEHVQVELGYWLNAGSLGSTARSESDMFDAARWDGGLGSVGVCWLVGWLAGWLVGWMVGWMVVLGSQRPRTGRIYPPNPNQK